MMVNDHFYTNKSIIDSISVDHEISDESDKIRLYLYPDDIKSHLVINLDKVGKTLGCVLEPILKYIDESKLELSHFKK